MCNVCSVTISFFRNLGINNHSVTTAKHSRDKEGNDEEPKCNLNCSLFLSLHIYIIDTQISTLNNKFILFFPPMVLEHPFQFLLFGCKNKHKILLMKRSCKVMKALLWERRVLVLTCV